MSVPPRVPFRGDIEGLRALAILLVIAFHVELPGWSGGFVGVDVFFVISGYLITSLLTHELVQSGRIDLVSFYARRARRLLPASALMVLGALVAAGLLLAPIELERLADTAMASAAYVSNFYFIGKAADYFAPDVKANPLLHTWSLSVEEQFYLFWPAIFAMAFRFVGSKGSLRGACLAITILSLAVWMWASEPWAFFGSPARAWEFGVGALASLVSPGSWRRRPGRLLWLVLGCFGLAAILASAHWFDGRTAVPRVLMLVPTVGTAALLVACGNAPAGWISRMLGAWPLQVIGRLSYAWYLWHWPILVLATLTMPSLTLSGRLLCVLLAFLIAGLSYLLLERPVRSLPYLTLRPAMALVLAAAVTGVTMAAALGGGHAAIEAMRAPESRDIAATVNEPSILNAHGCLYPTSELVECEFGRRDARTTVVLFGDSLAGEWAPAINTIAVARGWRLVTLLKAACSPADIAGPGAPQDDCSTWRAKAIARVIALQPKLVIVSSSRLYPQYVGYERWRDGFRRTLSSFASAKIMTVVFATTPMTGIDVPACVLRVMRHGGDPRACDVARDTALDARFARMERDAISGLPHVTFADFSEHFCDDRACPAIKDGILVYLDQTHTTQAFTRTLLPSIARVLVEIVGS